VWGDEHERRIIKGDVQVAVFVQGGLFLLHLLGVTETNRCRYYVKISCYNNVFVLWF
jgi:hypothetical protein